MHTKPLRSTEKDGSYHRLSGGGRKRSGTCARVYPLTLLPTPITINETDCTIWIQIGMQRGIKENLKKRP